VNCGSDISGNLLGDFAKGDPSGRYPDDIVQGIKLHRFVDGYTDAHPCMKNAKCLFPQHLRRFAPIALDMFWDHCLASCWSEFSSQGTLSEFVTSAECNVRERYAQTEKNVNYPESYVRVTERMWQYNWLESYARLEVIELALERMSQRSRRMAKLAECFTYIQQNYDELMDLFGQLYPDVLEASEEFFHQMKIK
jgi:acyl carrier protein phosphodiesterase